MVSIDKKQRWSYYYWLSTGQYPDKLVMGKYLPTKQLPASRCGLKHYSNQMKDIAKLNSNFKFNFNLSWLSINFVSVHPPTHPPG